MHGDYKLRATPNIVFRVRYDAFLGITVFKTEHSPYPAVDSGLQLDSTGILLISSSRSAELAAFVEVALQIPAKHIHQSRRHFAS